VFLLLLCNDKQVLGPWVNGRATNLFTAMVVAVLVTLSIVLTASVLFPNITANQIFTIMQICGGAGMLAAGYALLRRRRDTAPTGPIDRGGRLDWRMPPLAELTRPVMSTGRKLGMGALRLYLAIAMILVIIKITQTVLGH
jgi:FtsH-binding integral membrane protein